MKKCIFILGVLAVMMVPAILSAADQSAFDPLAGAVKFGQHEDSTELVWMSGRIEAIDETGIRVDDRGYGFLPDTEFYSATGGRLSWMNFHPGTRVKFVIRREPVTGYRINIVTMVKE